MGKFKVGDRVRVIDESGGGKVGDGATITAIDEAGGSIWDGPYYSMTGLSRGSGGLFECRLELIEPDATTTENWDFDPRRELKVGDRVRATGPCQPTGRTGVFVGVNEDNGSRLIEFDDWCGGHDGFGRLTPGSENGWFVRRESLELIPPSEPEPDLRVRVVADMSQLDGEIDRILRRLKKVEKKARKLGIRLEFRDAA